MVCATLWGVTACGGNAPTKVTITTTTAPALIAFRDGVDAPWQTPVATGVGRYEIEVHGPYTVEEVCTDAGSVEIAEVARTPDDPRDLDLSCFVSTPLSHVTGTMVQGGEIALGTESASGNVANWPFDLATGDGTFDLIARTNFRNGSDDWIAIHRDLAVTGSTMVAPIDAVKDGAQLVVLPLTVTNELLSEYVYLETTLATRSTRVTYFDDLVDAVHVVPDTILLPTDTQRVVVTATLGPDYQSSRSSARTLVPGGSTVFTLPPALGALQFAVANDQLVATWSTLPAYDRINLEAYHDLADGTIAIFQSAQLSAGYVAATGISSAILDTDIPGYAPTWHIDFTKQYTRIISARKDGTESKSSFIAEEVNGPSPVSAAVSPVGRVRACSRLSCDGGRR